jgi:bifunctional DNA-binding transcriptional regulator/antitoxin component of YhaV-PrlF toxin-antitoxin module
MGYESTIQVIQRGGKNRQYYLICPAPLAQALEIEKGEVIEWVVKDKHTLVLRRPLPRRTTALNRRRQRA